MNQKREGEGPVVSEWTPQASPPAEIGGENNSLHCSLQLQLHCRDVKEKSTRRALGFGYL